MGLSGSAVCEVAVSTKLGDGARELAMLPLRLCGGTTVASAAAAKFERDHQGALHR